VTRKGAVLCLVAMLATPAWAGFYEGVPAYDRRDYSVALREWLPLAEQGDISAQYNLGLMYEYGRGVVQDYAEAAKWYMKAAEQGDASAQENLGIMYHKGRGVPRDYAEAAR